MAFFKKSNVESQNESENNIIETKKSNLHIKILGSGCATCKKLEKNTNEALKSLSLHATVDHVSDFAQIASYGVMSTPGLVVNENVVSYGKLLKVDQIQDIIKEYI